MALYEPIGLSAIDITKAPGVCELFSEVPPPELKEPWENKRKAKWDIIRDLPKAGLAKYLFEIHWTEIPTNESRREFLEVAWDRFGLEKPSDIFKEDLEAFKKKFNVKSYYYSYIGEF